LPLVFFRFLIDELLLDYPVKESNIIAKLEFMLKLIILIKL